VTLIADLPPGAESFHSLDVEVFSHYASVFQISITESQLRNTNGVLALREFPNGGYHVTAVLHHESAEMTATTAFDVRTHWWAAPRYSFVCDYTSSASDPAIQDFFRKFHLNVTQFYDWMERHDALVPTSEEFVDPMGRTLNRDTIVAKLHAMTEIQSAAIGYAAIYASLADYAKEHPEQGIYDNQGRQHALIDKFFLMDITQGSAWRDHILNEFEKVVRFGFDGLHLDQYGFPKSARRLDGTTFWMDEAYRSFIHACRQRLDPQTGLIFNAVSSYPVHAVSSAEQDAVYIEVWPPMVRYRHLYELITRVRLETKGNKQVILAAYLKPFHTDTHIDAAAMTHTMLLVTATIFASGGYHLVLGETGGMLTEAYYPDYAPMAAELVMPLRAMYDILTADADLLSAADVVDISWTVAGGINEEVQVHGAPISVEPEAGHVWIRITQNQRGLLIQLVNLLWVESDKWNHIHDEPFRAAPPLEVNIEWNHPVEIVWVQRAEQPGWQPAQTEWQPHVRGESLRVSVPSFDVWSLIFVPYETSAEKASS
jgi:dextranase